MDMGITHTPYAPFDPSVGLYMAGWGVAVPWEYAGWRPESMAAKTGCYLHAGLNPTLTYVIKGPDALRLLSDLSVNSFAKFDIGAAKHVIMVSEEGFVQIHGMALRLSDDEFATY
ncbi:MAG TPA: hypothetical protein VNT22_10760, partial [Baekduia sp.]|nr:hypothetical protein [Baekduia sp.]